MRGKDLVKRLGGQKCRIKIRYFIYAAMVVFASCSANSIVSATRCPSLRVVFVRGSGGERWDDNNYLEFKNTIESKLATTALDYEFIDLDYPAIGIGIDRIDVTLGAYFGAGEAYEFGESVKSGVKNLDNLANSFSCPSTKYVIGGYSQGAMVVSKSLRDLIPERVIYAATFGDPKIYLPEGKGLMPIACSGKGLSSYRRYVPDCHAYRGLLGAYNPYEPAGMSGKVGTWCNRRDIFCSSHLSISDHTSYITDNLYEDASRVIFDKITKQFGLENHITSPHDTAILIDSTRSMYNMILRYKAEAMRLAKETLDAGGRVALYDYRDLKDPYEPVKHCDFETCTLKVFQSELENIWADEGGDPDESLLSASFYAMNDLKWNTGSTKSLIVLTDGNFLSPDRDGISFDEVVRLSKQIDPVNFYIITTPELRQAYEPLAEATDGMVVTSLDEFSLMADYVMERYDSLPRVEEAEGESVQPKLEIKNVEISGRTARVEFSHTGIRALVVLNDTIIGATDNNYVEIHELDFSKENFLTLVPLGDDVRGEEVLIDLNQKINTESFSASIVVPKAPNTGRG